MNVVILMPMAEQHGGGELMLLDLLRHTPDGNVRWTVVFFEAGPLVNEVKAMDIDTHVVETGRLRDVTRYVRAVWDIVALVREKQVDLILGWSGKPHLYGGLAAFLTGVPSAWYQLGFPVGRHLSWMDRMATLIPARAIITLSRVAQKGQNALWPSRPTRLVYPSVRLDRFDPERLPSPAEARRRLGLPAEGPLVGIVGRLQRWKGIHTFVDAIREVLAEHPDAHGVIVGGRHDLEPGYADEIEAQVAERGLKKHITLAGFQSNVPEWMQAMDVVVHASDNEPFGIVIIEAMALGKPVVAGASGGPREIITEEKNGLLAPYGNARDLSEQIVRFLDNPSMRHATGEAARRRAQDFSPGRYARNFIRTIGSLL